KVKASTKIVRDSILTYDMGEFEEMPINENYSVLFEDEHLFIVNKPAGIPVHSSGKYFNNTLISILRRDFPDKNLNLINRLDRETSGVILLGKTVLAQRNVGNQFIDKQVRKTYITYTFGEIKEDKFEIDAPLAEAGKSGTIRIRMVVDPVNGLHALTRFETAVRSNGFSKVFCYPVTGRTNQIRAHLAHKGFPIVGDKLYSGNDLDFLEFVENGNTPEIVARVLLPRQALHAYRNIFLHPETGQEMDIIAPLPEDLIEFEKRHF
ncbi:MAG: RluA family pseudouridine synthase, partial [Fibrobacteres bacterium]|nr:RluA family pseudouridine synthase [Fibrobacterota bacterium]